MVPGRRKLLLIEPSRAQLLQTWQALRAEGTRDVLISGLTEQALGFITETQALTSASDVRLWAAQEELANRSVQGVRAASEPESFRAVFVFRTSAAATTAALLEYANGGEVTVIALQTPHYFSRRPLLIQSVPKSGTHLVFEIAKKMGFAPPPSLDLPLFSEDMLAGHFYNLQHMRSDCLAKPYREIWRFVDAFAQAPVIFIFRHPADVAVSLAQYLPRQKEGYHILSSYMNACSPAERVSAVITGVYPIPIYINREFSFRGNIRDLFMIYAEWLTCPLPNVIPVCFEELVGEQGGGCADHQLRAIWRLQLALNVPGTPADFADGIFNENSLTFRKGKIGSHFEVFTPEHHRLFSAFPQDFMEVYGYAGVDLRKGGISQRANPCRRRETFGEIALPPLPLLLIEGWYGFNILRYRQHYIAMAQDIGPIDITSLNEDTIARLMTEGKWLTAGSVESLKGALAQRDVAGEARSL